MGWDSVPWMVGGGAEHSTNVARNVAFAAFGGEEGIVSSKDLEVRELAVPGSNVRVFPGTVAIQNRAANIKDEMYVGRNPDGEDVAIAPTTSLGARSDLIVARVENPYLDGEAWNQPTDPKVGPYIFTRVISNVPPTTTTAAQLGLGYSMIALARIDIPASTGTITQAMITDLRKMSAVQYSRDMKVHQQQATEYVADSGAPWPAESDWNPVAPEWATHFRAKGTIEGVRYGGIAGSYSNVGVGWQLHVNNTAYGAWNTNNLEVARDDDTTNITNAIGLTALPESARGNPVNVCMWAYREPASLGKIWAPLGSSSAVYEIEWLKLPETNA